MKNLAVTSWELKLSGTAFDLDVDLQLELALPSGDANTPGIISFEGRSKMVKGKG
jgi:hypothetical protein